MIALSEMTTKRRSPGNTAISVSLDRTLVNQIDQRTAALGLSRSQYLRLLAQRDLTDRTPITVSETPTTYLTPDQRAAAAQAGQTALARQAHPQPASPTDPPTDDTTPTASNDQPET